jgi:hypothetical protein
MTASQGGRRPPRTPPRQLAHRGAEKSARQV